VTDALNGLRFDIYERVQLPDDVAAIDELEEIELVPHMQALPQEDQVLLRGHLLLSGIYRSEQSDTASQLEHWIPVEISLPLSRIQSVEELAVEIDNFDVDLLTARSLNVTGVLALRGLQVSAPQVPIWREDSFTVVHQAQTGQEEQPAAYDEIQREPEEAVVDELFAEQADSFAEPIEAKPGEREEEGVKLLQPDATSSPEAEPKENGWLAMFQSYEEQQKRDDTPDSASDEPHKEAFQANAWGDISERRFEETEEEPAVEAVVEEKQDMKVALGVKQPEAPNVRIQSGVGLLSQLGEKGAKREADLKAQASEEAEDNAAAPAAKNGAASSSDDELEWTRLFLSNGSETNAFRKVKMCIVQREETLETIATRYNIQTRELQLYNRLQDPYLSEGQVLYIP